MDGEGTRHQRPATRAAWRRLTAAEDSTGPVPIVARLRRTPYENPRQMEVTDEEHVRIALDVAMRVGDLVLRGGAGTAEAEASVIAVAAAFGLGRLEVDITNQSVTVHHMPVDGPPVTLLRVVRSSQRDYSRLVQTHRLVRDLTRGEVDPAAAVRRVGELETAPKPWPRWVVGIGWGLLAASVAVLLGGDVRAGGLAFASAFVVDEVGRLLTRGGLASFYVTLVGGLLASTVTVLVVAAGGLPPRLAAPVIAGGIVVLLPGRAMVSAVEDAINGFPVTAAGRLVTVLLTTTGIVGGVSIGLALAVRLLDTGRLVPQAIGTTVGDLPVTVTAAAVAGVASALAGRTGRDMLGWIGVVAALGYLVGALSRLVGAQSLGSTALAAVVIGVLGRVVAVRAGAPSLVVVAPAISALLPGLTIYRGLAEMAGGYQAGFASLIAAGATAMAIGTGVVLGDIMAAPVARGLDQQELRRRRR